MYVVGRCCCRDEVSAFTEIARARWTLPSVCVLYVDYTCAWPRAVQEHYSGRPQTPTHTSHPSDSLSFSLGLARALAPSRSRSSQVRLALPSSFARSPPRAPAHLSCSLHPHQIHQHSGRESNNENVTLMNCQIYPSFPFPGLNLTILTPHSALDHFLSKCPKIIPTFPTKIPHINPFKYPNHQSSVKKILFPILKS